MARLSFDTSDTALVAIDRTTTLPEKGQDPGPSGRRYGCETVPHNMRQGASHTAGASGHDVEV